MDYWNIGRAQKGTLQQDKITLQNLRWLLDFWGAPKTDINPVTQQEEELDDIERLHRLVHDLKEKNC